MMKFSAHEISTLIREIEEPKVTKKATERLTIVPDANYEKANLKEVIKK